MGKTLELSGAGRGNRNSREKTAPDKQKRMKRGRGKRLYLLFCFIVCILAAFGFYQMKQKGKSAKTSKEAVRTAAVERRNIASSLSSSGTISPKDTYSITSMAEGEVVECTFEEGDVVTEGQILYRIDASSMESKLNSANNSLERSQNSYNTALEDYNEALSKYSNNTYKATKAGFIKKLYIAEGDKVGSSTQIADIYNDQVMKIKVPFLSAQADQIGAGMAAVLTLSDTLEQITGVVVSVSSLEETMTGGRLVRYVTIQAENPGGLTAEMAATAAVGEFVSTGDGNFTPTVDTVMGADLSSNVEVEALLVNDGDYVDTGTPIFAMKASTAKKLLNSYKDSVDSAESKLEEARSSLDSTKDNYDNYTITAPISGTVIQKNIKVGDKVQNGSSATALAVIYDMSAVTFEMNIDELDISKVSVGQTVAVQADAFENQQFAGKVTKVSLEGTNSNGVTYYPVTVTLDEAGSLLPGMNVDGVILLEQALDVLSVPADALMRGNKVYVRDSSATEAQGRVPAGFREVEVETGLINSDYVEIRSGDLKEGDEVYVAQSSANSNAATTMIPGNMSAPGGMGGGMGAPGGAGGSSDRGGRGAGAGSGAGSGNQKSSGRN